MGLSKFLNLRKFDFWLIVVCIILAGVATVLADWWSVAPNGSDVPKIAVQRVLFLSLLTMVGLSSLRFLFFRKLQYLTTKITIFSLGFLLAFLGASSLGNGLRLKAFQDVVERGNTIVDAVEHYIRETGEPPSALEDLIPKYIKSIPKTGIAAYPYYRYQKLGFAGLWKTWVPVDSGLDKGSIIFMSEQNYPDWWDRIGKWAVSTSG